MKDLAHGKALESDRHEAVGSQKVALCFAGIVSLVAGLVGSLIPGWPTACLLLSTVCFSRSSGRASQWMHTNRWFGPYLRAICQRKYPVRRRVRLASLLMLWLGIGIAVSILVAVWWIPLFLLGLATIARWRIAWIEANEQLEYSR